MTGYSDRAPPLGMLGVWATEFRFGDRAFAMDAAAEVEDLGYGALWLPGGRGGDLLERVGHLLEATRRVTVATGILNIWMHEPAEVAGWWRQLPAAAQERTLLGLGVGHASVIGAEWQKPLDKMAAYLDELDSHGLPVGSRCIAALGPKMLDLARDRSAGAHPYLVPSRHTALARSRLGPQALLAPEQGIVLESDPAVARRKARQHLDTYIRLQNYRNSWQRMGFDEGDLDAMSDSFIDALFAWGPADRVAGRLRDHFAAGADHVCYQVVSGPPGAGDPQELRRAWRELAPSMIGL